LHILLSLNLLAKSIDLSLSIIMKVQSAQYATALVAIVGLAAQANAAPAGLSPTTTMSSLNLESVSKESGIFAYLLLYLQSVFIAELGEAWTHWCQYPYEMLQRQLQDTRGQH